MLSAPEGSATVRDHLAQAEAANPGLVIQELHPDPPPQEVAHLWGYFLQISRERNNGGFGPSPISSQNISYWQQLREIELMPFEIDAILAIDEGFMEEMSDRMKKAQDAP